MDFKKKVLYLEDEMFFFDIVCLYSKQHGDSFTIVNAPCIDEAKELFEDGTFDAIICDFSLSGENGLTFLDYIRNEKMSNIPFIFLTGCDDKSVAVGALNGGADYFFEKNELITGDKNNFPSLFHGLEKVIERKKEYCDGDMAQKIEKAFDITAHDIANAVTAAMMGGELILATNSLEDARVQARNIIACQERVIEAINFCKNYKKLSNCVLDWRSLKATIHRASSKISGVSVINDIPEGLDLYGDLLLEKAFYNLFENAIRHGKATTVRCYVEFFDKHFCVLVKDNGCGVPLEKKSLIFKQGYGRNTGYGLFFCKEVLAITGMEIIEAGNGSGAEFKIRVPDSAYRGISIH